MLVMRAFPGLDKEHNIMTLKKWSANYRYTLALGVSITHSYHSIGDPAELICCYSHLSWNNLPINVRSAQSSAYFLENYLHQLQCAYDILAMFV